MSECLFCKIIAREIPANVVGESDGALAFYDIAPQAPVHVLVVPKRHVASAHELSMSEPIMDELVTLAQRVARDEGVDESGYRLVVNVGEDAQMTVAHLHLHVLGGRRLAWPPG